MALGAVDVVCVGNLVADLIVRPVDTLPQRSALAMVDAIDLRAGGCALTTAVVLGRLGARASMLGMVGDDLFGRFLLEELGDAGVDRSGVVCHPTVASVATVVWLMGAASARTCTRPVSVRCSLVTICRTTCFRWTSTAYCRR